MAIEIISPRERREEFDYALHYECIDCPGAGFGPECDENGKVLLEGLNQCIIDGLKYAEENIGTIYHPPVIHTYVRRWVDHAVGRCHCGEEIVLSDPLDNECEHCHRIYNMCGQELRPRDQWEEPMDYDY